MSPSAPWQDLEKAFRTAEQEGLVDMSFSISEPTRENCRRARVMRWCLVERGRDILDLTEAEGRDLTAEERQEFEELEDQVRYLDRAIAEMEDQLDG